MTKIYLLLFFVSGCLFVAAQRAPVSTGAWTWVNGEKVINPSGVYGVKGVIDANNTPGARMESVSWKDKDGTFWLFGGQYTRPSSGTIAGTTASLYNDLWKYNPATNVWTWISGDNIANQPGVYGSKGAISAKFKPGGRRGAVSFTDAAGTLWLFGGFGYGSAGTGLGELNDLWQYTAANGWVWISGDNSPANHGLYGSKNKASAQNKPGGREGAVGWTDASNNFWLSGGKGVAADTLQGYLNDVWEYNIKSNRWVWVSGTNNINIAGIYGQKGSASIENAPGSRAYAVSWMDKTGNLWLHGGEGYIAGRDPGLLDDLWKFDPIKMYWTWVGGDNTLNQPPVYGTLGNFSTANKPGGRAASLSWTDSDGNFWLFGGAGYDISSTAGSQNDLWKYDVLKGTWTWISGDRIVNQTGIYATKGLSDLKNKPGGRYFSGGWIDNSNSLWLFGGNGYAEQGSGFLNDLWVFSITRPLACPSSITLRNDTFCSISVYGIDPVINNNTFKTIFTFSGATTGSGSGSASGASFNVGITTVVYQVATDTTQTCRFTVEVDDKTAPVPLQDNLPAITGDCSVTVTDRPKAKDNCAGIITGTTSDSLSYNKQGTYSITWTYNDGHNNITTQKQLLVVKSGSGVLAPLATTLPDVIGECAATVTDVPKASKSCAGIFAGTTSDPLSYSKQGTYVIHWTYNDGNGSIVQQLQKVIVKDVTSPVPLADSLPDITGLCSITVTTRPVAADNCAGKINGTTTDPLNYNNQGTYIINWIYNDGNGNAVTQQQRVIVQPGNETLKPFADQLPVIISECSVAVNTKPQASGSCGTVITATTTDPLVYNKQGEYLINWMYTGGNGNSIVQQQKVIIKDSTAPVPVLQTLPDITGSCSLTVTSIPAANDNCAGMITATTKDPLTYTTQGTHLITWQYDDGNGNLQTQTQKVIMNNPVTRPPVFFVLPDIIADCEVLVSSRPTMADLCVGRIMGSTTDSLYYNKPGTYIIHWQYITSHGDTVLQKQSVIIKNLSLSINAFPNPATNYFNVTVKSCRQDEKIELRVYDVLGRIIENRVVMPYQPFTLGSHYAPAAYFIQVTQGKERITQKLIKLN